MLESKVTVCKPGDVLTPEQCKILEFFEQKSAVMKVHLHAVYNLKENTFKKLEADEHEVTPLESDTKEEEGGVEGEALMLDGAEEVMIHLEGGGPKKEQKQSESKTKKSTSRKGTKKGKKPKKGGKGEIAEIDMET